MVVMARSVPLSMRVMISVHAQHSAETSGKTAATWNVDVPGRRMTSTPRRPTPVAIQRRNPTVSFRKMIECAVTNSGATKPVAEASAIGRKLSPVIKNSDEPSTVAPRMNCRLRRSVFIAYGGEPGIIAGTMISANTRNLIQVIAIGGSDAERYFAVTSDRPRNTVEARISAIPLNGRSARAGALGLAGLRSGRGTGALSSLAAAAGGGFTADSGGGKTESNESKKTPIGGHLQGTIAGCRYALRGTARG